ncbi:uncharacterized protein LOC112083091 [Eutrema salsugineum]|uniref:uncharacterized protein LOC112083091 n=1 Tax=Eutrema salsugineum TaxID=72664 RepID=UPI000CED0C78|nr:uncharacterized protein LOC112083091 [Eutrema salsugineum]
MSIVEWHSVPAFQEEFPGFDSDGEDRQERYEYDIEEALTQFTDGPPIMHNVYPDIPNEGTEEQQARKRRYNIRRGDGNLFKGQLFTSGIAFKEAVLDYALKTGYNISQNKYDKTKLSFTCGGEGCSWRIYSSISGKSGTWQVVTFQSKHTCVPNGKCKMLKAPVIARLFLDKIREEPEYYMPMKLEEMIMEKWRISVSRPQCQHARNKALKWIAVEYAEQFARLRDYKAELELSNPNSSVVVDCVTNDEGQHVFQRFYVCFDNLRKSWKQHCRPLIGVDGCFLKTVQKGELFIANGRDADNRIYPIAWAVVQKENTNNWSWFFQKIKADLELGDGDGYVLVSDRQKGFLAAVKDELPKIEHRMCVRHIYMNLKARNAKKPELKGLIWNLAWSYNEPEFRDNLKKIELFDEAVYADLMKTKPETWFIFVSGKARDKALVPMLETIARLAMVRIAKRSAQAVSHEWLCTPYVSKYLAELHEDASKCIVQPSTNMKYYSSLHGCAYRVDLVERTCTCRRWEITGIPCEHAYGVMIHKKMEAQHYICHWFRTLTWRNLYTDGVVPVRGARFWPVGEEPSIVQPPVPDMPGRNKVNKADKKRKKGQAESPVKKKKDKLLKRIMHCKVCGAANHNSRFHKKKNKTTMASLGESSSQPECSQGVLTQLGE